MVNVLSCFQHQTVNLAGQLDSVGIQPDCGANKACFHEIQANSGKSEELCYVEI